MNNTIRHRLILFNVFIFISSILLCGCSNDKIELNETSIVTGIGIDKISGNKPFLVTLEIIDPKSTKNDNSVYQRGNKSIIKTSSGKSIFDAIQNFSRNNSTIIDFSHAKTIILSKNLCESGISEVMDYLNRNRQIRSNNWILISNKTSLEILKNKMSREDTTSMTISNMMNRLKKDPSILPVTLNDFIIGLKNESRTTFVPVVDLKQSPDNTEGKITIERTSIFKNNHLIGMLTNEESKDLLWLVDYAKGHIVISLDKLMKNNENVTVDIFKKSSKIIPHITKDTITMEIQCTGDASIREIQNITMHPEILEKIKNVTEITLTNQLSELIDKSQKRFKADLLGFSTKIYNNHPKKWIQLQKDWDKTFPTINYTINFQIEITNIGIIKDSVISNN